MRIIYVTLLPVGPRAPTLAEQWFAAQLSATFDPVAPVSAELFPWTWKVLKLRVAKRVGGQWQEAGDLEVSTQPRRLPPAIPEAVVAIKDFVAAGFTNRAEQLPHHLAYLSTLPGGLPEALGLTHYFQLPAGFDPQGVEALAVAPISDPALGPRAVPEAQGEGDWLYSEPQTRVRQRPLTVAQLKPLAFDDDRKPNSGPGLNVDDYWVPLEGAQPWAQELVPLLTSLLNTYHQVSEAVPSLAKDGDRDRRALVEKFLLGAAKERYGTWAPLPGVLLPDLPSPNLGGAESLQQVMELGRAALDRSRREIWKNVAQGDDPEGSTDIVHHLARKLARQIGHELSQGQASAQAKVKEWLEKWLHELPARYGVKALQTDWEKRVEIVLTQALEALEPAPAATAADRSPSGITVKVYPEEELEKGSDATSSWAKVAGVGLMIRRKDKVWRLASAAHMIVLEKKAKDLEKGWKPHPELPLFSEPVFVPTRIPYRDGVRYPYVTYNQRSLAARSPLEALHGALVQRVDQSTSELNEDLRDEYGHRPVIPTATPTEDIDRCLLTPLQFGEEYEVSCFLQDTAGGLPSSLAGEQPFNFKPGKFQNPKTSLSLSHHRRVPVGLPRLEKKKGLLPGPEIFPLSGDLPPELDAQGKPKPDPCYSLGPLLCLPWSAAHREHQKVVVGLRVPTVEINVLERHGLPPEELKRAWRFHLAELTKVASKDPGADPSFDDPMVSALKVTAWRWSWDQTKWLPIGDAVSIPTPKGNSGGVPWRSEGYEVECLADQTGYGLALSADERTVTLHLPKNAPDCPLVRFQVEAVVAEADRRKYFPKKFFEAPGRTEPVNVLIEAIQNLFPTEDELWKTLTATKRDRAVDLSLEVPGTDAPKFRCISHLELVKQPWRWQGRPLDPMPSKEVSDVDPAWHEWEAMSFAELHPLDDSTRIPIGYPHLLKKDAGWTMPVWSDRLAHDFRALYLRYSVRAESRYAALFHTETIEARYAPESEPGKPLPGPGWRRVFLPYVGPPPSKPVIQAIVPLTSSETTAASLLLILNEAAFASCGLNEHIKCKVLTATSPQKGEDGKPVELQEFGYDPILSSAKRTATLSIEAKTAMGFSYDQHMSDRRYVASSYELVPTGAEPWSFAKICFARSADRKLEPRDEEYSAPVWVQFLPSANFGETEFKAPTPQGNAWVWSLTNNPQPPQRVHEFKYFVLLTEKVWDVRGDSSQRRVLGVTEATLTQHKAVWELRFTGVGTEARLLEVQVVPGAPSPEARTFWDLLIKPTDEKGAAEAAYRITRMSRPVPLTAKAP